MILRLRLLSATRNGAAMLAAAATFVVGLAVGAIVGPATASLGHRQQSAAAQAPAPGERAGVPRMTYSVDVLRVVDGDTFEARVNLWPGLYTTTKVRLRGIDAPEMSARCADERTQAEIARHALRSILDQGEVGIARVTFDKYSGRVLADALTHATPDVSEAMLATGRVRPYSGGRRESWCDGDLPR
jgi:endonuclease YncB( thermonuclease family)